MHPSTLSRRRFLSLVGAAAAAPLIARLSASTCPILDDPEETVLATVTVPTQIVEPEPEEEELEEGEELAEGEEPPEGAAEGEEPSAEGDSGQGGEPETTEG